MDRHNKTMTRCQITQHGMTLTRLGKTQQDNDEMPNYTTEHGMKLTRHRITGHHDMAQEALRKNSIR